MKKKQYVCYDGVGLQLYNKYCTAYSILYISHTCYAWYDSLLTSSTSFTCAPLSISNMAISKCPPSQATMSGDFPHCNVNFIEISSHACRNI